MTAPLHTNQIVTNRVFIVHGHDDLIKQTVARIVEKIGFETIILHEQPNKGRTIIEKFIDFSDVGCAIVLLSPDDVAIRRGTTTETAKYRAHQNVILELGFFIGKLGRERVFALHKKEDKFEIPSDFDGVVYLPHEQPEGTWRYDLAKELQQLGYSVDFTKI